MKPLKETKLAALYFRVKALLDQDKTGSVYLVIFGLILTLILRLVFGPNFGDLFMD